jgi:hypothetical protein
MGWRSGRRREDEKDWKMRMSIATHTPSESTEFGEID